MRASSGIEDVSARESARVKRCEGGVNEEDAIA